MLLHPVPRHRLQVRVQRTGHRGHFGVPLRRRLPVRLQRRGVRLRLPLRLALERGMAIARHPAGAAY